jgi:ATPase subunit of ABC transporter with duplicated ATPase domains
VHVTGTIGYVPQQVELGKTIAQSFSAKLETWQIQYALSLVALDNKELHTPVEDLSGGQKTRLAFAMVLAQDSELDLLVLDEPTNNLDAAGLLWLDGFVRAFPGAVLLVSHDRSFINSVATKVVELHAGKLKQYTGNYDFYQQQKELERTAELATYQQNLDERQRLTKAIRLQQENSKHTHEHIRRSDGDKYQRDFFRNRVATKLGKQARALERRLEQLDDIERPEFAKNYSLDLVGEVDSSKLILKLDDVTKQYTSGSLSNTNLEIRGNNRIHVRGLNGAGKSTLLRIAAGLVKPTSGTLQYGTNISVGYFSQDVDGLNHEQTGLQNLQHTEATLTTIYREARSLSLTQHDLTKPVRELSRGQQAKLGFAKLLLAAHNLLILDEPTNHLDLPTRINIEDALQEYKGAVLFASHDAYFAKVLKPSQFIDL